MVRDNIIEVLKVIAEEIPLLWQKSLKEHNVESNAEVKTDVKFPDIEMIYPQYFQYVEEGRKPKTKKVPIEALIEWARKKGISTDNATLFSIQESIYKNGIKPRPVFLSFEEYLEKGWETWSQNIFQALMEEIDKIFN